MILQPFQQIVFALASLECRRRGPVIPHAQAPEVLELLQPLLAHLVAHERRHQRRQPRSVFGEQRGRAADRGRRIVQLVCKAS